MYALGLEDRNLKFDHDTYQQSKVFQYYHHKFSCWYLMNKYFDAKKDYYNGNPTLTDFEFDSLERSIDAIAGEYLLQQFGCVGYDPNQHKIAINLLEHVNREIKRRFTDPWNDYVKKVKSKKKLEPEVIGKVLSEEKEGNTICGNSFSEFTSAICEAENNFKHKKCVQDKDASDVETGSATFDHDDCGQLLMF